MKNKFYFAVSFLFVMSGAFAQTFPYAVYNSAAGNQNIRDGACTSGTNIITSLAPNIKLVASTSQNSCSYLWYRVYLPSVLQSGNLFGWACGGSPGGCDMMPASNTGYVEVYNTSTAGLFVRTSPGIGNVTIGASNAKIWDTQCFATTGNTQFYSNYTWYEIYLPNNCSQTTGWCSGQFLNYYPPTTTSYSVTTSASPSNGGSTSGGGAYSANQSVTVSASPNAGWSFLNWTENSTTVSSSSSWSFNINSNRSLVANFTPVLYTISTSSSPSNGGTTSGGGSYQNNQSVNLTATPNAGWNFVNWTINSSQVSTNPNYSHVVTGNATAVANFSQTPTYLISTSSNPSNGGTTAGGGIYQNNQNVVLTASPNAGWNFVNWTINSSQVSTNPNYAHLVTGAATVVANFSQTTCTISTSSNPSNGGATSGGGAYLNNQTVVLTATPSAGWSFVNWTINSSWVSANPNYSHLVNGNVTVVANFVQGQGFSLDQGLSHLEWPFPNTTWVNSGFWVSGSAGGGYGTGQGTHIKGDYYAQDWNNASSGGDCDSAFNSPLCGTIIWIESTCNANCTPGNVSCGNGYGNNIVIVSNFDTTYAFRVAHLKYVNSALYLGGTVDVGDYLGNIGQSGDVTGAHAHCVLFKNIDQVCFGSTTGRDWLSQGHSLNGCVPISSPNGYAADFMFDASFGGDCGFGGPGAIAPTLTRNPFQVFPNPNTGFVTIAGPMEKTMEINILNTLGQIIETETLEGHQGKNTHHIDLSSFEVGIYVLQIRIGDLIYNEKIVINK